MVELLSFNLFSIQMKLWNILIQFFGMKIRINFILKFFVCIKFGVYPPMENIDTELNNLSVFTAGRILYFSKQTV